jgi:hypothetical protein
MRKIIKIIFLIAGIFISIIIICYIVLAVIIRTEYDNRHTILQNHDALITDLKGISSKVDSAGVNKRPEDGFTIVISLNDELTNEIEARQFIEELETILKKEANFVKILKENRGNILSFNIYIYIRTSSITSDFNVSVMASGDYTQDAAYINPDRIGMDDLYDSEGNYIPPTLYWTDNLSDLYDSEGKLILE